VKGNKNDFYIDILAGKGRLGKIWGTFGTAAEWGRGADDREHTGCGTEYLPYILLHFIRFSLGNPRPLRPVGKCRTRKTYSSVAEGQFRDHLNNLDKGDPGLHL